MVNHAEAGMIFGSLENVEKQMSFFIPPQKPMPEGYPLPAIDAHGVEIRQGALARILMIPHWLTHDLPTEDVTRLKAVEGTVMRVLEVDAYG